MLRGYKGTMVADTPVIGRSNAAYWDSLCSLGRAKAQPLQHLEWVYALDMADFSGWGFW
jgi:hypothetical protein